MKKISTILEDIAGLKKRAFIPNPQSADPNSNPQLGQMYQQLQAAAQNLPPEAQQQLSQQIQQLQQLPMQQQEQTLQQLTQQVQQSASQQPGAPSVPPGQDPNQGGQPGGDPSAQGQDPSQMGQPGQPSSGGGNEPGTSQLSNLDKQTITMTVSDLLNIVSSGKHAKTTSAIQSSKRDADLNSQMLAMKHQEKIEDFQKKQKEKEMQEAQQQAMQQQQQQGMMGGNGLYAQPMGQPPQGQPAQPAASPQPGM